MHSLIRLLLRFPHVHDYLRKGYADVINRRGAPSGAAGIETSVAEVLPLGPRRSERSDIERINLLLPALSVRHVFGGISTALQLFEGMLGAFSNARIILTDEQNFSHDDNPAFQDWQVMSMDDGDRPGRLVVPAGNRYGRTIAFGPHDHFVATAWWTAELTRQLIEWQGKEFGLESMRRFAYVIQDYEPGFYPWSARYVMADSTYRNPERLIPVFNTSLLRQFFIDEGYGFENASCFEPGLHPVLRATLADVRLGKGPPREKRVLVYGRPQTARNGFPLIIEALKRWIERGAGTEWQFVSLGESHPPIDLGAGRQLISRGKLSIEGYADELARSSIGLSLMVSPHPSYPPMEMAAFGLRVVTNGYKSKDLSQYFSSLVSLPVPDPDSIADCLERLSHLPVEPPDAPSGRFRDYLTGGDDLARLGAEISRQLLPSG